MSIEIYFAGPKKVCAKLEGFTVETDQAVRAGGEGSSPTPFALFLSSLGTCAGIYVKGFCDQRGLPTQDVSLSLDYNINPATKNIGKFIIKIFIPSHFPEKYDSALVQSASLCAVKRHLDPAIENEIIIVRK
ncbi:MAG: OsmC family protein [Bacteroidetes bacterium]|nr:OsmC family protein [Bacteroidota bacterium]